MAHTATSRVTIQDRAVRSVTRGHPWIYREAISSGRFNPGDYLPVFSRNGTLLGYALGDPTSPIALRLWGDDESFSQAALRRIREAFARRRHFTSETSAYRLIHGEGDRAPGFVVDRYGSVAVLKVDGAAALIRRDEFAELLWPVLESLGIQSLLGRQTGDGSVVHLRGSEAPRRITAREHGRDFVVDLFTGQKTGAFLDQRENRRRVGEMAANRSVLNLFSYAGGFSLHAALGGASSVTSVDLAAGGHAAAQESFTLNGIASKGHEFVTADAFVFLDQAAATGRRWDLVVSDPPSFAPSEKSRPRALAAYRRLHRACARILAAGGTFCAASCSSHIDLHAFLETLDDDSLGRKDLSATGIFGPPEDHPVLPAFPEGNYLKFVVLE